MREFWPILPFIVVMLVAAGIAIRHAERVSVRAMRNDPTEHGPFS